MEYRVVGSRIAVDFSSLFLPVSKSRAIEILVVLGFKVVDVDVVSLAKNCVGVSKYRRGARNIEAPVVVDCSSFMRWLYGQKGIWLPRRSIQQREFGETVELNNLIAGDVIFVSGFKDYFFNNPNDGVGHVGIYSGCGTVIHAKNSKVGVVESSLKEFVGSSFRGARRYLPQGKEVLTLETPIVREVETSDDIRWIILQNL